VVTPHSLPPLCRPSRVFACPACARLACSQGSLVQHSPTSRRSLLASAFSRPSPGPSSRSPVPWCSLVSAHPFPRASRRPPVSGRTHTRALSRPVPCSALAAAFTSLVLVLALPRFATWSPVRPTRFGSFPAELLVLPGLHTLTRHLARYFCLLAACRRYCLSVRLSLYSSARSSVAYPTDSPTDCVSARSFACLSVRSSVSSSVRSSARSMLHR